MPRRLLPLAAIALLGAATCSGERTDETVRKFFREGKIGHSVDYGLYQLSELRPGEWDHIASVHGMSDDWELCTKAKEGLEAAYPAVTLDCRPLN